MCSRLCIAALGILPLVVSRIGAADAALSNDLVYVTHAGEELKLDLGVPEGDGPFPLIVFIHGGGWQAGGRKDVHGAAKEAVKRGYAAAAVSYRFTPKYPWPAQLDDVRAAVRWLRSSAAKNRIDARRVAAVGWSAGGHLSLMLGVTSSESSTEKASRDAPNSAPDNAPVDAVVNYFGPTDMTTDVFNDFVDKLFVDLAGGTRETKASVYKDFSPVAFVSSGDAPVLTFQGTTDVLVPVDQARILHKALDAAHVPNRLEILEGQGHGWGGADLERTTQQAFEFLDSQLKGSSLPLLLAEDFTGGAGRWEPTEADAWKIETVGGLPVYALGKPQKDYQPKVRSPLHYSLVKDLDVADFNLDVTLQSTVKDYGHRDLCLFLGWQDPEHFYYVHLAKAADPHAHSVFLVNGADRVSIATERTQGVEWGDTAHRVRVRRDTESGAIDVFFDDLTKPIIKAVDKTFLHGRIGVGSFDDQGRFTTVRLRGKAATKRA